jgi:predicted ribosome quality control (RQC) complex YloA/Tae2 family protein
MKTKEIYIKEIDKTVLFKIGRNAKDNFDIIDSSNINDLWFHVDNLPSAHIISSIPENINKKELKYIIKNGAMLCKQHSKFNQIKDLNIVYTKISNVIKTEVIGTVNLLNSKIIKI